MIACLTGGWPLGLRQAAADPILSPAEVVALRFPDELMEQRTAEPTQVVDIEGSAISDANEAIALLFNPYPTYPSAAAARPLSPQPTATPPVTQLASLSQSELSASASTPASPGQLADATKRLAAAAAAPHSTGRPGAVLSDGQIASIKRRLRLTPDQQQMWPAVEVALRSLNYAKKGESRKDSGSRIVTIDPDSSEVKQLTSAAFPLVMSFSDDQKRELHVLAHVAGLEQLVPKF
jgi:hypothetical protein